MVTNSYTSPLLTPCTGNFLKCDRIRNLPDPCPHLKITREGAFCEITNKRLERPWECIRGKYVECPIYKRANEEKEEEEERVELVVDEKGRKTVIIREKKSRDEQAQVSCRDCLFYSSVTGKCVKLKVKVENPDEPPCEGKYFRPKRK